MSWIINGLAFVGCLTLIAIALLPGPSGATTLRPPQPPAPRPTPGSRPSPPNRPTTWPPSTAL